MKRLVAFIYFSLLGLMAFTVKGQDHCGFDEMHKSRMENDEEYRKYINDLESKIKTHTKLHKTNYRSQPPVYDVLWLFM